MNSKVSCGRVDLAGEHTLTRESQEVMVGLRFPTLCLAPEGKVSKTLMLCTSALHSGQLNITTSTLSTPAQLGLAVNLNSISVAPVFACSMRSCVAHMLPAGAVSEGLLPSKRTLEAGSLQVTGNPEDTSEQRPFVSEPLIEREWRK